MRRWMIAAALLLFSTVLHSEDFVGRELPHLNASAPGLQAALPVSPGELVLVDGNSRGIRFLRFSDSGQLLAASALRPARNRFVAGSDGVLISSGNPGGCDVMGFSANGSLLWRFSGEPSWSTCTEFASDGENRLWFIDENNLVSSLVADAGAGTPVDLYAGDPQATLSIAATYPAHPGAIALNTSRREFASISADGTIDWRYLMPAVALAPYYDDVAITNETGQSRTMGYAYGGIPVNPLDPQSLLGVHVAAHGAAVTPEWQLDLPLDADSGLHYQHLFADGTTAIILDDHTTWRIILINATGAVVGDRNIGQPRSNIYGCSFVATQEQHWALCNASAETLAVPLESGSSFKLADAAFSEVIARADGTALLFFPGGAPFNARVFDGSQVTTQLPFIAPAVSLPGQSVINSRLSLAGGDDLLLWSQADGAYLTRIGSDGGIRWSQRVATDAVAGLIRRSDSQLILAASHVCTVLTGVPGGGASGRTAACFDPANGVRTLLRNLPGSRTEALFAAGRTDGLALLFRDGAQHAQHWLLDVANVLQFSRDLGESEPLWLDDDVALARNITNQVNLVRSDIGVSGTTTASLPTTSPLAIEPVVARIGNDGWLTSDWRQELLATTVHVRRYDGNFSTRWTRSIAGQLDIDSDQGGLFAARDGMVQLLITEGGAVSAHVLDLDTGTTLSTPAYIGTASDTVLVVPDSESARFGIVTAERGSIVWRAYRADAQESASHAWRCPHDCEARLAHADATGLKVLASSHFQYDLTLADPYALRSAPVADDGAIAGVFTAVNETNRGYVIDWLPSSRTLFVARFAGDTSQATVRQLLDWETMQGTVNTGASEVVLTRYRSANGRFAAPDDAPTTAFGSATFRFDGCDRAELTLTGNETFPAPERVQLTRSGPRLKACNLLAGGSIAADAERPARGGFDARQSGAWIAPGANDQGILAAVLPATADTNGVFFAPWFTYWPDAGNNSGTANRHWLTLQGTLTPASNGSIELTIFRATAGSYGPIRPSNTYRVGTATWTLTDCEHATLSYQFDADESAQPYSGRSGVQNYARPGACSGGP